MSPYLEKQIEMRNTSSRVTQSTQQCSSLVRNKYWLTFVTCIAFCILISGCKNSKQSLYEEIDHETPAHWPSDMADTAVKIKSRLATLAAQPDDSTVRSELVDLISWCGEVAADTDVTEQQWQPIYDQSEVIRKQLQTGVAIETLNSELQQLCTTLETAHQTLPTQQPL